MHLAVAQGMTGDQTLQKAKEMRSECDEPQLEQFVRHDVDSHVRTRGITGKEFP